MSLKNPFIGQLDRKIKILEPTTIRNTTGEEEVVLNLLFEPWAQMMDVSGDEDVEGKIRHLINRAYVIRHNPLFLPKNTELVLEDEGIKYRIIHFMLMGRKRFIQLKVELYE